MSTHSVVAGGRALQGQIESSACPLDSQQGTRVCTHAMPAAGPLRWLEDHAPVILEIQELRRGARLKNRVILTLREGGRVVTVGAPSVAGAVFRVRARMAAQAAKESHETETVSDVG